MECYLSFGYFSREKLKMVRKNQHQILEKFKNLFEQIVSEFDFSDKGFEQFCNFYRPKIVRQLPYNEIP